MALENALRKAFPEPETPEYRQAPHNIEVEQALLGAVLVNNEAFYRVSDFLEPKHFFEPIHQQIFEVAASLIRAGKIASPVTIKTFIPAETDIAGLNPTQYLARLAAEATTIINSGDYGRTIYDLATRRDLIQIGQDMVNVAYDAPVELPPQTQIEDAERRLYELAESGQYDGGFMRFSEALKDAVDLAARAYQREGGLSGVASGFTDLDQLMGGLQRSDLIIIAGRPAMGKTALATNIAYAIASDYQGEPKADGSIETVSGGIVGFFSLEMSAEQLATRVMSEQAEIASSRIRRGEISKEEFSKIASVAQHMESVPLYIDDTGGISIAQLVARARRLKRQRGLDVMIVDYLQLLTGAKRAGDNRVQEVTEITTGLKALAKELNVPIIALSQLSRQVEARDDKRPQLADLRESGSIEQDADVVLFVFREEYYLKNKEPKPNSEEWFKWETEMKAAEGRAEIIIGKQRHGPTGTVKLSFESAYTRFGNLANADRLPERRP
ncbi:MAG TPA: replicative DNA helicase [Xanthobacteraceae bacterium]|nr:replicative DNA helicase [Xanthobacteraceae bacterium]